MQMIVKRVRDGRKKRNRNEKQSIWGTKSCQFGRTKGCKNATGHLRDIKATCSSVTRSEVYLQLGRFWGKYGVRRLEK
ncbi:hypothetical protein ILYODFUR_012066 [Ilyodon furcidens]|uniref:Uncharacterized protein n=1 Tax=Ilyodon furcidens TaxID=33524 RepID=A0ABV0SWB2_9TELE